MEQIKKNRSRTHYRNYVNEKLTGNITRNLNRLERFISLEVIEKETIERVLIKYFLIKRSRTFYRNFVNKKLVGSLGKRYRKFFKNIDFNYEKFRQIR